MNRNIYLFSIFSVLLLLWGGFLINTAMPKLLFQSLFAFQYMPHLEITLNITAIIVGLMIWFAASQRDVTSIFKFVLVLYLVVLLVGAIVSHYLKPHSPHAKYLDWSLILLYIFIGVFHRIQLVFVWGVINRCYNYQKALKDYATLCFLIAALSAIAWPLLRHINILHGVDPSRIILLAALSTVLLLVLVIFGAKNLQEDNTNLQSIDFLNSKSLWIGLAFLLAVSPLVYTAYAGAIAHVIKNLGSNMREYHPYMIAASSLIWFAFAYWAMRKRSWGFAIFMGTIFMVVAAIILAAYTTYAHRPGAWALILFRSNLFDAKALLLFPLVQMLYLLLPARNRFRVKVATELLALPIIIFSLPSLNMVYEIFGRQNLQVNHIYFQAIAIILLALAVIVSRNIGKKISLAFITPMSS